MPLVKQSARYVDGDGRCFKCQASITWARIKDGAHWRPIAIEPCAAGGGHIAFTPTLFRGPTIETPIVVEVVNGTSYRKHDAHCPGPRSFTGQARDRKRRRPDA